jgi:hypothetical protein
MSGESKTANASPLKYMKPKIMLIDMPSACNKRLVEGGYNVSVGSFGSTFSTDPSDNLCALSFNSANLPNCHEQEIIIVNANIPKPLKQNPTENPGKGVDTFWQLCDLGIINQRNIVMHKCRDVFNNIYNYGGLFVVFLSNFTINQYLYGSYKRADRFYSQTSQHDISLTNSINLSSICFLDRLSSFEFSNQHGFEIEYSNNSFSSMLKRFGKGSEYHCVIAPNSYSIKESWISLAKNKYGADVAGILSESDPNRYLILLPQMPESHLMMRELIEEWCAHWKPALFPYNERVSWIHRREYEIPSVLALSDKILEITKKTEVEIADINTEIESIKAQNADWYTLLRGTGDELKNAVIRCLKKIGFLKVIDVDEEAKVQGTQNSLREDIQIHDLSPTLVVDVKGVSGHPDDDESRQAEKHALMRIREWNRADVQPLTIINHQRHLPPHDRDQRAYREEIIKNAEDTRLGLMTTWDLFCLLRNMEVLAWPDSVIKPIFYRVGRIDPIPVHYQFIGTIKKSWEKAFGIIPNQSITVGNSIAIKIVDSYEEYIVKSLQVNDATVQVAEIGAEVGVVCDNLFKRFKHDSKVFLVDKTQF